MRKHLLSAGALIALSASLLVGCQPTPPASPDVAPPDALLERTTKAIESVESARCSLDIDAVIIDGRYMGAGEGAFTGANYEISLEMDDGQGTMHVRTVEETSYTGFELSGGSGVEWRATPVRSSRDDGLFDMPFNPRAFLRLLPLTTFREDSGVEDVGGTECRHLTLAVDAGTFLETVYGVDLPPDANDAPESIHATTTVDAWIDESDALPRKMVITTSGPDDNWTWMFWDYGEPVIIENPLKD